MPTSKLPNQLDFVRVTTCRLCGSRDLNVVLELPDTPFGDRYLPQGGGAEFANLIPLEIVQCVVCNNFQTSVVVNVNTMYEHYLSRPGAVNKVLSASYREYAEHLDNLLNLKPEDLVVEIGSNDGLFVSYFAKKNIRCLGVDPAQNLAEVALSRGVKTVSSFFGRSLATQLTSEHGKAKLIVANFMVANVPDLDDFMSGVSDLLADDGIYAMETNYVLDVVDKMQLEVINHEHITYFSVESLSKFLDKHGLEIFKAKRVPSKSGSLRCFIGHKGRKFAVEESVSNAKHFESKYGIFMSSVWQPMAKTIDHVSLASRKYFGGKNRNEIVAYGSSIGATTLLYSLNIGEYFQALIDDDPYRQDLESPGWAIPTVSSDKIFADPVKAKVCAVLAPRYVSQIVEKNQHALESGVTFLRVWPMLEEVPYSPWRGESSKKDFEK